LKKSDAFILTSFEKYKGNNEEKDYWGKEEEDVEPDPPMYIWEIWWVKSYEPFNKPDCEYLEW